MMRIAFAGLVACGLALTACASPGGSSPAKASIESLGSSRPASASASEAAPSLMPHLPCGVAGGEFISTLFGDTPGEALVDIHIQDSLPQVEAVQDQVEVSSVAVGDSKVLAGDLDNGAVQTIQVSLLKGTRMLSEGEYLVVVQPAAVSGVAGEYGIDKGLRGTFVVDSSRVQQVCAVDHVSGRPTQIATGGSDSVDGLTAMVAEALHLQAPN